MKWGIQLKKKNSRPIGGHAMKDLGWNGDNKIWMDSILSIWNKKLMRSLNEPAVFVEHISFSFWPQSFQLHFPTYFIGICETEFWPVKCGQKRYLLFLGLPHKNFFHKLFFLYWMEILIGDEMTQGHRRGWSRERKEPRSPQEQLEACQTGTSDVNRQEPEWTVIV